MFPRPTIQCFQVREQQQPLRQPNITSPVQTPLRPPNVSSPVQPLLRPPNITSPVQQLLRQPNITSPVQQSLRRPNITSPVQPPLRPPNITSPAQQTQPLRQPTTTSPEQQKQPLLAQPNISQGQQRQGLLKLGLQSPVQQEPSPLEVKSISGQPQKKTVSLPKTLWQRLHPEEDELSLLVKSHFAEKQQNSVIKKKKLSAPRKLKLQTLKYSTDPLLQGIPILKEQAPTLALKQQSPQQLTPIMNEPTPTLFLKQHSPHQITPVMNEPNPTLFLKQQSPQQVTPIMKGQSPAQFLKQQSPLQTIPIWRQEQIDLQQTHTSEGTQPNSDTETLLMHPLQKTPITKPRQHSELLQHQKPTPSQSKQSTEIQQIKHIRQDPEESLLQMYSHFHEGTGDEDTQPKYIPKARIHTKLKKGLTKKEAKNDAAEEVLRLLMNKQMRMSGIADQNQEKDFITISDSEDDEDSPISMKQLTSLALYKLFEDWKKTDTERCFTGADVDPLASLHPCDLLGRMRGSLTYNLLLQQTTPQGKEFFMGLTVDGSTYVGKGITKKEARYRAAKGACEAIFKVVYT